MWLVTSFTLLAFAALPVRVATHLPDTGLEPSYPIAKKLCALHVKEYGRITPQKWRPLRLFGG